MDRRKTLFWPIPLRLDNSSTADFNNEIPVDAQQSDTSHDVGGLACNRSPLRGRVARLLPVKSELNSKAYATILDRQGAQLHMP